MTPIQVKNKKFYDKNQDYFLEKNYRRFLNNTEGYLHSIAKNRAKRKGLDFDIEVSDIIIPERCPYLDIPLTRTWYEGKVGSNPSLDRIDNTKGYVKGNVQVISNRANRMKVDASLEELIIFAKGVLNSHT